MVIPVPIDELAAARATFGRALDDLLAVPDESLERAWDWPGHGEADVRYGLYRVLEDIEAADARVAGLAASPTRAQALIAPATVARWDAIGALLSTAAADLDADPGGDEWTVRQAMAHTIFVQWSYAITTDWWRDQRFRAGDPALPPQAPDLDGDFAPEATAADGEPSEVRRRLHEAVDAAGALLSGLADDELELAGRWSGLPVTVGFRLGRWSSHIQEHTVQVDKTLVLLGRRPSEVERIVRLVTTAWGRLEARVWPGMSDAPAVAILSDVATRAGATAAAVRSAASG